MAVWIENWNVLLENKAAVDAIKFTLNNDKKAEPIEVMSKPAPEVAPVAVKPR
jgi:ribonucleoside-diphosphate reductase alpha chain